MHTSDSIRVILVSWYMPRLKVVSFRRFARGSLPTVAARAMQRTIQHQWLQIQNYTHKIQVRFGTHWYSFHSLILKCKQIALQGMVRLITLNTHLRENPSQYNLSIWHRVYLYVFNTPLCSSPRHTTHTTSKLRDYYLHERAFFRANRLETDIFFGVITSTPPCRM